MNLEGKIVLITGASGGIGAASARVFAARGAKVSLLARNEADLARVAGETGGIATAGDVTNPEVRARAVEATLQRFGRIDVLVNNAGVGLYAPSYRADMAGIRRMLEVNLFAPLELVQAVVPVMKRQKSGTIVNVSSIGGKMVLPWFTMYSASKYALMAMTDGQRIELRRFGIHTIAVCPGYVKTGFQSNTIAGRPPDRLQRSRKFAITAEECAEALVRGVERQARTVVTPWSGWLLLAARALFPTRVDRITEKVYEGLDIE